MPPRDGRRLIVAGGDGTVFAVLNALAAAGLVAEVGVVPAGTANDLARELGLPTNPQKAAWLAASGEARPTDLLAVRPVGADAAVRCVVGGGFGLPALCVDTVHALRARGAATRALVERVGGRAYQAAAPWHVSPTPPLFRVNLRYASPDGVERCWDTEVIAGFFLNQRTVGRSLLLAPSARSDDGVFELSFIMPSSSTKLLTGLWKVSVGRAAPGQVVVIPATHARLRLARPTRLSCDGEPFPALTDGVDISVVPGAVRLVGPSERSAHERASE